ncbi:BQ2448_7848 [Microbotryum intermedium]|uniref:BQ2448_7848 protein n=1 Tax=Microbotryum intermedium TaxID=269621 RepID=A0A238FPX6_9BASI|nr:BQ2448_7848 [Microbotryum intermedium]
MRHKPSQPLRTLPPAFLSFLVTSNRETYGDCIVQGFLSGLVDVEPESLPHLVSPQFIAEGGFSVVRVGQLIPASSTPSLSLNDSSSRSREQMQTSDGDADGHAEAADRLGESTWIPRTAIPTDYAVVIKLFWEVPKGAHEALFYEHVFPRLPSEARALLPTYDETYRAPAGDDLGIILGYGGRRIEERDVDEAIKKKLSRMISDAFRLFDKCGVEHMDRELCCTR